MELCDHELSTSYLSIPTFDGFRFCPKIDRGFEIVWGFNINSPFLSTLPTYCGGVVFKINVMVRGHLLIPFSGTTVAT